MTVEMDPKKLDRVEELFRDKTIFITGASGFVGKVLVEKLLRCLSVKTIYVLVRPKRDKEPRDRLYEIFKGVLFDKLRELKGPEVFNKVKVIGGDCSEIGLGISEEDRQILINEVNIVFHCAASVRFDEPLRSAVLLNVRGTKYCLELAKQMENLILFHHLSTAYCHLNEKHLLEKAYPPPADANKVIKTVEWLSDSVIDSITKEILGDIPNTYSFTKALGESLVVAEMDTIPAIITRPSIILPIWKEPVPGWTDNLNGPTGLLIGAGKGVIRTMYINGDGYGDLIPVDIVVNGVLCTCMDFIHNRRARIYHLTSSSEYKVSWEEIINIGRDIINNYMPLNGVAWYPGGSMKKSWILHMICFILFHCLPALFVDALLTLLGYKPFLIRVQKRIYKGFEVFEYYANNQWDFDNENTMEGRKCMTEYEREMYKVDGTGLNYKDYFKDCIHAARLYILKETDDTLPAAKRHMFVMWIVDKVTKLLMVCGLVYYMWSKFFQRNIA